MANNRLTQTNSRFLYETAAAATPTVWTAVAEGYTWSDTGRLFRVTADEAQFGTSAYVMQRTNESGDYADAVTITLDLPSGYGTRRTDSFSSQLTVPSEGSSYTNVSKTDTFDIGSMQDTYAYDQQIRLERDIGIIFEYAGEIYRGTITSRTDTKEQQPGGYLAGFEAVITTSRKQWSDRSGAPILGAFVKTAGVKYRIAEIVRNAGHFQLNLSKHHGG